MHPMTDEYVLKGRFTISCTDNDAEWQNTEFKHSSKCPEKGGGISHYASPRNSILRIRTQVPRNWIGEGMGGHSGACARDGMHASWSPRGSRLLYSWEVLGENSYGLQRGYPFPSWIFCPRKCLGLSRHRWPGVVSKSLIVIANYVSNACFCKMLRTFNPWYICRLSTYWIKFPPWNVKCLSA